ncbi:MAG TPA: hypothetical protein PKA20_17780 [Burkholderiaceae bacterium]|nr:hypothetical protein [Burkholderiaceae bacterium]
MRTNPSCGQRQTLLRGGLVTVVAAALLAATPTVRAADACTLLSSEEIAKIMGQRVRKPSPSTAQEGTSCRFPTAMETVTIALWPTTAKSFEEFRKTLVQNGVKVENASGLGDTAYFWDDRVYARVGQQGLTVYLSLAGTGGFDLKRRETAVAIAKAGIAKLR